MSITYGIHEAAIYISDNKKDSIAACCMLAEVLMRLQVCSDVLGGAVVYGAHIHESCLLPMAYMSHVSYLWHT
jgi:hypothetical protein